MATLGSAGAIGYLSMGGKKSAKTDTPPINASSADEEKFIQYVGVVYLMLVRFEYRRGTDAFLLFREFLKAAEEEKKQKH